MPKVSTNQIEINYQINGSGHPLLLIAGVGYSSWYWKWIVPDLALDFQVITFDNRGAGDSEKPPGSYTVEMMAADTAGLLDSLVIKGAYVMGHSLGGFIAQELVVSRPDLVSKLILASTTHGGTKVIPITPEALQVMTDREGNPLELVQRGIQIACAPGFQESSPATVKELVEYRFSNPVPPDHYHAQVMAGAGMAAFSDEQVAERMAAIKVPTLVLFGEHDKVVPPGNAELIAGKLRDARVHILRGAGHMFPIEAPDATVEVIRQFLLDG